MGVSSTQSPAVPDRSGRRNGLGVAALVVGVVALVLSLLIVLFPIAGLLGLIALILGIGGMRRVSRGEADNRGQAVAGLITGVVALGIAILVTVGIGAFVVGNQADLRRFGTCVMNAKSDQERRACAKRLDRRDAFERTRDGIGDGP